MAEFCLDCFNKYLIKQGRKVSEKDVILSDDWCEQCAAWKPCVVVVTPKTLSGRIERAYNITKSLSGRSFR